MASRYDDYSKHIVKNRIFKGEIHKEPMPKAVIVGAGLGGLTTALRLAKKGYEVTLLEKFKQAGGRLNQIRKNGFVWDMGPTFFSMNYEFNQFYKDCGLEPPFDVIELDPLYAVNFKGQEKDYLIHKNLKRLAEEFKDIEPKLEKKLIEYLSSAGRLYHDSANRIIHRNYRSRFDYLLAQARFPWKHAPKLFRSFWKELERYFESHEIKKIFSLVSYLLGETPRKTSALYTFLSYLEFVHDGYFNVRGGMYCIVEGLLRELEAAHVTIQYNTEITGFIGSKRKIYSLIDQMGEAYSADLYVINSDAAHFRGKVFNQKKYRNNQLKQLKWSMAPLTIYLGLNKKVDQLQHHHYFLGNDVKSESNPVDTDESHFKLPYYYVNTLSKNNPSCAPDGCESVYIICPVPNKLHKSDWSDRDQIVNSIIADLSIRLGIELNSIIQEQIVMDPNDWEKNFNLYQGSGMSLAHGLKQIGWNRPPNYDKQYKNVFYVGSSTLPGTGLSMSVIGSKLVTDRIEKKFG